MSLAITNGIMVCMNNEFNSFSISFILCNTIFTIQKLLLELRYFFVAHSNAKPYFDWYFKNERVEAHLKVHQTIKVELNGNCQALAKVLQIEDKILAKIHFEEENRFEWIYLGSPRIFAICRALIIQKVNMEICIFFNTNTLQQQKE